MGATTFVDFGPNGVGGQLLEELKIETPLPQSEVLPGYKMHLPGGEVRVHLSIQCIIDIIHLTLLSLFPFFLLIICILL